MQELGDLRLDLEELEQLALLQRCLAAVLSGEKINLAAMGQEDMDLGMCYKSYKTVGITTCSVIEDLPKPRKYKKTLRLILKFEILL